MKLELIKKFEPDNVEYILTAAGMDENTCLFLVDNKEGIYQLLLATTDGLETIDLGYTDKNYKLENKPVLFVMDDHFGVIKDAAQLLLFANESRTPEIINI